MSKNVQLSEKDGKFIKQKIIANHPAYILDSNFAKKLDATVTVEEILNFITEQNDSHFRVIPKNKNITKILEAKISEIENYDFEIDNDDTAILTIQNFEERPHKDFLYFCEDIVKNKKLKNIIIDVRNNGGGNSDFGDMIVKALFGEKMLKYVLYKLHNGKNPPCQIFWRNSPDILNRLKTIMENYPQETEWREVYHGLKDSQLDIYVQNFHYEPTELPFNQLLDRNIFILINGGCGSSTLDFIDRFEIIIQNHPTDSTHESGHIYLVGSPTYYDTDYMDILPISQSTFTLVIPMKKYNNRLRASGQRYYPDISMENFSSMF